MQLDSSIAAILGRPDLARTAPMPVGMVAGTGTLGLPSTAVGGAGSGFFQRSGGDLLTGRLTLGSLVLITAGLAAFYLWTREHQA